MTRSDMADVEHYAHGDFLADLIKGQADTEATTRLADKVAALTGIDPAVSRGWPGVSTLPSFVANSIASNGKVTGRYDASVSGFDPYPDSSFYHFSDPSGETLTAPLTSAAVDLITRKLNWRPDGSYQLLSNAVEQGLGLRSRHKSGAVGFPIAANSRARSQAETVGRARAVRSRHALFRLEDPCSTSLPAFATPDRVKLVVYPGGHMFYSRDASRQAFRAEVEAMMK